MKNSFQITYTDCQEWESRKSVIIAADTPEQARKRFMSKLKSYDYIDQGFMVALFCIGDKWGKVFML